MFIYVLMKWMIIDLDRLFETLNGSSNNNLSDENNIFKIINVLIKYFFILPPLLVADNIYYVKLCI